VDVGLLVTSDVGQAGDQARSLAQVEFVSHVTGVRLAALKVLRQMEPVR
jgi:hypothetical protein